MNYYLFTTRKYHPLQGSSQRHRGVKYDAAKGFITKGIEELVINLGDDYHPSFLDMIKLLSDLPTSVMYVKFGRGVLEGFSIYELVKVFSILPVNVLRLDLQATFENISANELANVLQAIPPSVLDISLAFNNLGRFSVNDLARILDSLHDYLTHLSLVGNELGKFSVNDLIAILQKLPSSIKRLQLHNNELQNFDVDDLIKILQAPLNLYANINVHFNGSYSAENRISKMSPAEPSLAMRISTQFGDKYSVADKIKILKAIPGFEIDNISALHNQDLANNNPDKATIEIEQLLQAMSPITTKMYLYSNYGNKFSASNFVRILCAMSKNIKELHLSLDNRFSSAERVKIFQAIQLWIEILYVQIDLNNSSASEIVSELNAIPKHIKILSINLSNPLSRHHTSSDNVKVLLALPQAFKKLRLYWLHDQLISAEYPVQGWNYYIGDKERPPAVSVDDIVEVLLAVPESVVWLDLRGIGLYRLSVDGFVKVLRAIHVAVKYLDLSENGLFMLGVDGIVKVLQSVPEGVTHLDLRGNLFHREEGLDGHIGGNFSPDDLQRILLATPKHVTHIYFDEKDILLMNERMIDNEIFKDLDFYYDFIDECCVRGSLLQNDMATEYNAPLLSFRGKDSVAQSRKLKDLEEPDSTAITLLENKKRPKSKL